MTKSKSAWPEFTVNDKPKRKKPLKAKLNGHSIEIEEWSLERNKGEIFVTVHLTRDHLLTLIK